MTDPGTVRWVLGETWIGLVGRERPSLARAWRLGAFALIAVAPWHEAEPGQDLAPYRNHRGEHLGWRLLHAPSGRSICSCRSPTIATAIVAELGALPVDWLEVDTGRGRTGPDELVALMGPVLARWACEGDATQTDRYRAAAAAAAGLALGFD